MIFHTVNIYTPKQAEEFKRLQRAVVTWQLTEQMHAGRFRPVYHEEYARSSEDIGDNRKIAFVKDVIVSAPIERDDDIVVLTNADSCLVKDAVPLIMRSVDAKGVVWSSRYDVDKPQRGHLKCDELKQRMGAEPHRGLDLVAFRWQWWLQHQSDYPDLLLGYEGWDVVMLMLAGEKDTQIGPLVWHEQHQTPYWLQNRLTSKGNLHNRRLVRKWLEEKDLFRRACIMWKGIKDYEKEDPSQPHEG